MSLEADMALQRASELMTLHGLEAGPYGLRWTDSKTEPGRCTRYEDGFVLIEMSLPWAQANGFSDDFVNEIILHEIAHALVGPERGHDAIWKEKCASLGAKPKSTTVDFVPPPGRFSATCVCGARFSRDRQPEAVYYSCPACDYPFLKWVISL